jgi:hypothetical protein
MKPVLGFDIGGVIINGRGENKDTMFTDNFLETPPVDGAFEGLAELTQWVGGGIHLVSKCQETTEKKTCAWLEHHNFHAITGILPQDVHFCRTRQQKGPICEALGITHFTDDRTEVLSFLTTVPHRFLFDADPAEVAKFQDFLPHVSAQVKTWTELVAAIRRS